MKNIVTGATGFLGSHLVRSLLEAQEQTLIISRDGWNRCRQLFGENTEALEVVSCDVLGLNKVISQGRSWHGATFWHIAANLQFEERHRQNIFDTNVRGTRAAIDFASRFGCDKFIYVSTAYTSGNSIGLIPEILHQPTDFNNVYEESKHAAEQVVAEVCPSYGMRFIIARPSIIVGNSNSYNPGSSQSGLYGFASRIGTIRKVLREFDKPLRLLGHPNALLDFCPVDHVVDDLLQLRYADDWDRPYHVTNGGHVSVASAVNAIANTYNIPGINVVADEFDDYNRFEKVLARQMVFYGSYISGQRKFVRTLCPTRKPIHLKDILKYIHVFKKLHDSSRVSIPGVSK